MSNLSRAECRSVSDGQLPSPILITGASGLLGSAVLAGFNPHCECIALGHRNTGRGTLSLDLTREGSLKELRAMEWNGLVHCAAYRNPDFCEEHGEVARELNAVVPGLLAGLAAKRNAPMVHISTDYVFDGTRPPYDEEDKPCPVNRYGETKLEAEELVRVNHPGAAVLRIPALYGDPNPPIVSNMIEEGLAAALADKPLPQDDHIIRFPTCVSDVAVVTEWLLRSRFSGIIHASADQKATRLEWARALAGMLGKDPESIIPMETDPGRKAKRPENSQLATAKLRRLGGPLPRPYRSVVPEILRRRKLI